MNMINVRRLCDSMVDLAYKIDDGEISWDAFVDEMASAGRLLAHEGVYANMACGIEGDDAYDPKKNPDNLLKFVAGQLIQVPALIKDGNQMVARQMTLGASVQLKRLD